MPKMITKKSPYAYFFKQTCHALKFSNQKFFNLIIIILCLSIIFLLTLENKFSEYLSSTIFEVNSGIIKILNSPIEMMHRGKDYLGNYLYLKEIKSLKEQNALLQHHIKELQIENQEIQSLKELLNFTLPTQHKLVTTKIIKSSINTNSQEFLLPIGSSSGIQTSAFVLNSSGLVGKVIDVNLNTARVKLITHINSKTPVMFAKSRQRAILAGNSVSSTNLNIIYCPNLDQVEDGELVVTSGDGNIFPSGIIVGHIVKGPEKTAVKTSLSLSQLEFVKVYATEKQQLN